MAAAASAPRGPPDWALLEAYNNEAERAAAACRLQELRALLIPAGGDPRETLRAVVRQVVRWPEVSEEVHQRLSAPPHPVLPVQASGSAPQQY